MGKLWLPDWYVARISMLRYEEDIRAHDIRAICVDMDNTLVSRETHEIPRDVRTWITQMKAHGITLCIVTNNWHSHPFEVARELGIHIVAKAMKPLPFGLFAAARLCEEKPRHVMMVGDQLSTDIIAGNMCGMYTVLTRPLASVDLKHMQVIRKVEQAILARSSVVEYTGSDAFAENRESSGLHEDMGTRRPETTPSLHTHSRIG